MALPQPLEMATIADHPTDSADSTLNAPDAPVEKAPPPPQARKGIKFWTLFVAVALAGLLPAMEATIISTALPEIIATLGGGSNYFWVASSYFLSM